MEDLEAAIGDVRVIAVEAGVYVESRDDEQQRQDAHNDFLGGQVGQLLANTAAF